MPRRLKPKAAEIRKPVMPKVWVYPEKTYEVMGAVRYEVSWEQLRKHAEAKHLRGEEIDFDADITHCYNTFKEKSEAIAYAKKVLGEGLAFFGEVTVCKQVVDWFVEEDGIAEWVDTKEEEHIS